MKKSKSCPKCSSTEIFTNEGDNNRGDRCSIPVTSWRSFFVSVYICMNCGYVEEYLAESEWNDRKMLNKIKEVWKKVS